MPEMLSKILLWQWALGLLVVLGVIALVFLFQGSESDEIGGSERRKR